MQTAPALPKIDTWRVAADGEALVAGKALPGATVSVVVDDQPVAEGTALASGEFVLQFTLPPNPSPSLLWLTMAPKDGQVVVSPEMVALAPITGPEIAAVAPEPPPTATPEPEPEASVPAADGAAKAAPPALLVTGEGAVVLQDAAAADPALALQVTVDTITYTPEGEVQIGGRGAGGAVLRLYLDNGETAAAAVADDGRWLVTLGDVAPGVYTLRVDQLDALGKVTSRYETPFKRETLEALALASGASAPGAATDAAPPVAATLDPAAASSEPEPVASAPDPAPDLAAEPAPEPATVPASPAASQPEAEAVAETASAEPAISAPVPSADPTPQPSVTITVQPGFTLWGIAQDRLGDGVLYVQVFDANRDKIRDPDLIYPGQVISLPASPAP
jgi:nucleoid-associated protein YgaU